MRNGRVLFRDRLNASSMSKLCILYHVICDTGDLTEGINKLLTKYWVEAIKNLQDLNLIRKDSSKKCNYSITFDYISDPIGAILYIIEPKAIEFFVFRNRYFFAQLGGSLNIKNVDPNGFLKMTFKDIILMNRG